MSREHAAEPSALSPNRGPLAATPQTLATRRLILRPLRLLDASEIARFAGDWDVARMTGRIPYPYSREMAAGWIADLGPDEGVWAIEVKDAAEQRRIGASPAGCCGYVATGDGSAEIGYWIAKPAWGRGYATEAARALVSHCFRTLRFARLTSSHFVDNPASGRVIEKLGFRRTGETVAHAEARKEDVAALTYERRRPLIARLGDLRP
jgi:RimJ/RimL family protein N-acetyltransferase